MLKVLLTCEVCSKDFTVEHAPWKGDWEPDRSYRAYSSYENEDFDLNFDPICEDCTRAINKAVLEVVAEKKKKPNG